MSWRSPRKTRPIVLALAIAGGLLVPSAAGAGEWPPQIARGVTVPAGFAATVFTQTPIVPTTLTWGPDPGADASAAPGSALHGTLLYVGGVSGNPISCDGCGTIVAFTDEREPVAVAEGLNSILGIAFGPDETLYVTDNLSNRGRVLALNDTDGDRVFETQRVLLRNIPNGRHQTNGLTVGPDGMVYVANGNATDNGLYCGPPAGAACDPGEVQPWTGSILRVNPAWEDVDLMEDVRLDPDATYAEDGLDDESVLVARGFRNIYDVDFNPANPTEIWTPMNGSDFPSSSEPLFALDVADDRVVGTDPATGEPILGPTIEDAGFPSCLYDPHTNDWPLPQPFGHEHPGDPQPQDNTDADVIEEFGPCPKGSVIRPRAIFAEGHEGTSGLTFERGEQFPARYDGDLFAAEWGSLWNLNGLKPTGHKVVHFEINPDGTVGREKEFMTGALPIDVTFGPNGHLFVADMTGQIYEVQHVTDAATPDVVTVDMTNGQFVPQVLSIVRGQTVRWCNSDSAAHNIRAVQSVKLVDPTEGNSPLQPGDEIDSPGDIPPGQCYSHLFDHEAGAYHYNSTTGAEGNTMRGTIVVAPIER